MLLDFPGVTASLTPEVLLLHSPAPLQVLASSVVGGGFAQVSWLLNRHVPKNYDHPDPEADLLTFARTRGIDGPFVGLMTAAYLERTARAVTHREGDITVAVVATAGVTNATAAGQSRPVPPLPGTINIILLVDANLLPAAMVNAVITATEAKTHTLLQRGVLTPEGEPATGTSTDAMVVACTGRGAPLAYAGLATPVGWLIGRGVRQALNSIDF